MENPQTQRIDSIDREKFATTKVEKNTTIILPSAEEMISRLRSVDEDDHLDEFYHLLAENEGRKLVAAGIAMMYILSADKFVRTGYDQIFFNILMMRAPEFTHAIIDDSEVAKQAIELLKK